MESIGKSLRPAQGDAMTPSISSGLIGSRSVMTRRNQSTGTRRSSRHIYTLVGTSGHLIRGKGSFMRFGEVPPAGQASMSASYRREGRGRVERYGDPAERPDLPRVARIAQAIAQKDPPAGHVALNLATTGAIGQGEP